MIYDKLVRDNELDFIRDEGKAVCFRVLSDDELVPYLKKKLNEEVAEFQESESVEELADIYEVLFALIDALGYDDKSVFDTGVAKRKTHGGFNNKICLIEVEEDD